MKGYRQDGSTQVSSTGGAAAVPGKQTLVGAAQQGAQAAPAVQARAAAEASRPDVQRTAAAAVLPGADAAAPGALAEAGTLDDPGALQLVGDAVQRVADAPASDGDAVHRVAAAGVAGSGGPLPHADAIQRSFGPDHDVSGIDAHVGGAAADAAAQIGARAYATGTSVAFRESPDLFTAAHEAAHVVQQRQGVHLAGGVGASGDVYEQHADAVAERVVRGEPAGDLLTAHAGGGVTRGVQRDDGDAPAAPALSPKRAEAVAQLQAILEELKKRDTSTTDPKKKDPSKGAILSDRDHDLFANLTGTSQEVLEDNWDGPKKAAALHARQAQGGTLTKAEQAWLDKYDKKPPPPTMTACNGFTGAYGNKLHQGGLGAFTLATTAAGAFIKPGGGRFPREGDVVKMSGQHVCVSMNAPRKEGDAWEVIEAGQGGPGQRRDILKYNKTKWSSAAVEGWVDIDLWADQDVRDRAPVAAHLIGKWQVKIDWRDWIYQFASTGTEVTYVDAANPAEGGRGAWSWKPGDKDVTITWDSGTTETWPLAAVNAERGRGALSSGATGTFKKTNEHPVTLVWLLTNRKWNVRIDWRTWRYTFSGDRVSAVDTKSKESGGSGSWAAQGRKVTITWDSGTKEVWQIPDPLHDFTGQLSGTTAGTSTVKPTW